MHYPTIKLSQTAELLPGIQSQEKGESLEYPCLVPAQILPGRIAGGFGAVRRTKPVLAKQALRSGDVVVRRVNPDCAAVFEDAVPSKDGPSVVLPSANVLVIRPGPDLLPDFAAFLLSATSVLARLLQASGVATQVAALSPVRLGDAEIPLPPLAAQRRYAAAWHASLRVSETLQSLLEEQARVRTLLGDAAFRTRETDAAESRIPESRTRRPTAQKPETT